MHVHALWSPGRFPTVHPTLPPPSCTPPLPQDAETQVQWWLVNACDPAASTPGTDELAGTGDEMLWAKNRNVRLRRAVGLMWTTGRG